MASPLLAQVEIRERSGAGCGRENGFCPDWIADNLDKYWSPLLEHVFLTLVSLGIGFGIAFSLALLAHRQRWLTGPIIGVTGAM
jgi:osmoprotectant transport system permease protein